MASAIAYAEALIARGIDFDTFAPRLSFHFATTLDLFEEVAKLRAARRMWYRIATERFGATDPRSGRLRFFSGQLRHHAHGAAAAQQHHPVHPPVPGRGARRRAVDPRHGLRRGVRDPVGGGGDAVAAHPADRRARVRRPAHRRPARRLVLRGAPHRRARGARPDDVLDEIEALGGAVAAIERGVPQRWIAESAYRIERDDRATACGRKVGVNVYADADEAPVALPEAFDLDDGVVERQIARTAARVARATMRRAHAGRSPPWMRSRARAATSCPLLDRRRSRGRDASARCRTCSAACSASSGSRTRGERAARRPPGPRPHAVRRRVAGDRRSSRPSAPTSSRWRCRRAAIPTACRAPSGSATNRCCSCRSTRASGASRWTSARRRPPTPIDRLLASRGLRRGERAAREPRAARPRLGVRSTRGTRRIVYGSISGYGDVGPTRLAGGFDLILQAESGVMSVTGSAGVGTGQGGRAGARRGRRAQLRARTARRAHRAAADRRGTSGLLLAAGVRAREPRAPSRRATSSRARCPGCSERTRRRSLRTAASARPTDGSSSPAPAPRTCGCGAAACWGSTSSSTTRGSRTTRRACGTATSSPTRFESVLGRELSAHWLELLAAEGVPAAEVRDIAQVFAGRADRGARLGADAHASGRGRLSRGRRPGARSIAPRSRIPSPAPALGAAHPRGPARRSG